MLEAARALAEAAELRVPVPPLVETFPDLALHEAYPIQRMNIEARLTAGATIAGYKIGLTSPAIQAQMGVDTPDFGHLLDDMFYPDGLVAVARFLQPRVEPEIAVVLRHPLAGPGVTARDSAEAIDYLLPALEIIDSRIRDWKISLTDTIADNASSGGVVLGTQPVPYTGQDLTVLACTLTVDGSVAGRGTGAAVLGSPLNSLTWLANAFGEVGTTLQAGQVILTGSITAAVPVGPGSVADCAIDGIGSVTAKFLGGQA